MLFSAMRPVNHWPVWPDQLIENRQITGTHVTFGWSARFFLSALQSFVQLNSKHSTSTDGGPIVTACGLCVCANQQLRDRNDDISSSQAPVVSLFFSPFVTIDGPRWLSLVVTKCSGNKGGDTDNVKGTDQRHTAARGKHRKNREENQSNVRSDECLLK